MSLSADVMYHNEVVHSSRSFKIGRERGLAMKKNHTCQNFTSRVYEMIVTISYNPPFVIITRKSQCNFYCFIYVRSEERQYCWNCNSKLSPRCGRRQSRHSARSVSVPPARNVHQSVPYIRSKSMPYRKKDASKMPTSTCLNFFLPCMMRVMCMFFWFRRL